jgi:hypothetical protein
MVIIHTATTGHIHTTATILGGHTTMGTDTIATTGITTIISIKLM